jgi:hypothetical protein
LLPDEQASEPLMTEKVILHIMIITEKDLNGPKGSAGDKTDFSILEPMSVAEENDWTSKLIANLAKMEETKKRFNPIPLLPTGKRLSNR